MEGQEKDIFFHMSKYPGSETPVEGQLLEFTVEETAKGKEAVDIKVVRDGSEEEQEPEAKEEPVEAPVPVSNDLDQLNGVGPKYRELLVKAGINTCKEVTDYSPENLLAVLLSVNEKEEVTKRPPNLAKVTDWIALAKEVV